MFISEPTFELCLTLGLFALFLYLKGKPAGYLMASGLVFGWATLTRPFSILLLPALLGVLALSLWKRGSRGIRLIPIAAFAGAFLIVVFLWTARNFAVHRKFVFIATNGGSTFYGGNNDRVLSELPYLGGWISTTHLPGRALIDATPDEVSHDKMEWRLGLDWVRGHALQLPKLWLFKLVRISLPDTSSENKKFVVLNAIACAPYLVLFLLGAVRCARDRQYWTLPWLALHLTILATIATAIVFWGSTRFRDANAPVLMLYASLAWPTRANVSPGLAGSQLPGEETLNLRSRPSGNLKEPMRVRVISLA